MQLSDGPLVIIVQNKGFAHDSGYIASAACMHPHRERARAQVKDVVDGDLCEQFPQMPADKQRAIAEELERTPGEVLKKLEDLRNALL